MALITSNISRLVPERLVIDPKDELESGLRAVSAVACDSLATIHASLISKKIGSLSAATMQQIDECLKTALGLP